MLFRKVNVKGKCRKNSKIGRLRLIVMQRIKSDHVRRGNNEISYYLVVVYNESKK